jgi:endonuclease/exonuclease/phosphatase family metal-dependent hydrolase
MLVRVMAGWVLFPSVAAIVWLAAAVVSAPADTDVPVAGWQLSMRADAVGRRVTRVMLRDISIAAPLPDPSAGASVVFSTGAGVGHCHVEVELDPAKWQALGDGPSRAFRYLNRSGASGGIRRILLRPGAISISAGGVPWPCDLGGEQQRLPVSVVLQLGPQRYCSAFGGRIAWNRPGRLHASDAAPPGACPKRDLTVINLNVLHGIMCPRATRSCRLADRIDLLFQWIVARGCPDLITLQEVSNPVAALIMPRLADTCPFTYHAVRKTTFLGVDDEMVLSRYPPVDSELLSLYPGFRHALFVRIDHPIGPVDVFTTHMAASSDDAQGPCAEDCPPECVAAGAATVRECQAVQVVSFVQRRHDVPAPALVTGDFNDVPGSFVYEQFAGRGWVDVHLAAGNPECDPQTGVGCTAGREDQDLEDLESRQSNQTERIDYIFLVPPGPGSLCAARIDSFADDDGDGIATRVFPHEFNPFAPECGPAPLPICWPSDHDGVELDLNCDY